MLAKVGESSTASPAASSTGVFAAKDALTWHSSQSSARIARPLQSSQPQSSQQLSQPQLLQPQLLQPQPLARRVPQLFQPQLLQPQLLQPQLLQPQSLQLVPLRQRLPLQPLRALQGPQGPVKKGKLQLLEQQPLRTKGPDTVRSSPKLPEQELQELQWQPLTRAVAQEPQELQPQLLQPQPQPQLFARRVLQELQPQLFVRRVLQELQPQPRVRRVLQELQQERLVPQELQPQPE